MSSNPVKAKILYVDNDLMMCKLVSAFLERRGFLVRATGKGLEAVEMTREWLPDVILLDLMMPAMDGLQVAEALQADPRTQQIPIVAYTVVTETSVLERGREAGITGFISKATPLAEVVRLLPTYLP
jgi:two-component system, cell cycle response regulator DivK